MFIADFGKEENKPLYERLYCHFRAEIESGRMKTGEKLPSRRQLAARLKISAGTVESAYSQLLAEGYIDSKEKSGYYACALEPPLHPENPKGAASFPESAGEKNNYLFQLKTNAVATEKFPFSTWAKLMRESLSEDGRSLLSPSHPQGDANLRGEIVKFLRKYRGIKAAARQIVLGAGSEFLLSLILQLLGRGKTVAVENPGYRKTHGILGANGARISNIPMDSQGISMRDLENSGASIAHVTPSHHFPLAIVMPAARRVQLLRWASHGERYIIEDDYDSEFRFSGRPIPALQCLEGGSEKVIYINTFTKSLAPSLRVSYMVLPERLLHAKEEFLSLYSCTVPSFEQRTLWRFFERGHFERHLNRMKNTYRSRRDAFIDGLRARGGDRVSIFGENAGLHLLVSVANGMSERELLERAGEKGVRVYGLSSFYHTDAEDIPPSTVVVGYSGYDEKELTEAAELLAAAWFG